MLEVHSPKIITKQLAFNCVADKRRTRVSSNFLMLCGFRPGTGLQIIQQERLGGFDVITAPRHEATHIVYQRTYGKKKNSPLETVIEFGGQTLIDHAFPKYTERFHVEMRHGLLKFRPVPNKAFNIIKRFKDESPYNAYVALTGGVDVHAMAECGWNTEIVLEHRPQEARDIAAGRNLTEVHALSTLINGRPKILLNEDIHELDLARLKEYLQVCKPIGLTCFSLACDDFSQAKGKRLKERSLHDLSTTIDMVYPALQQIELMQPAAVLIENVAQFKSHDAGAILSTKLKRLGYHVTEQVYNSLDYQGIQQRKRYYLIASVFPGYTPPAAIQGPKALLWPFIKPHLHDCTDVSHWKIFSTPSERGSISFLDENSTYCSTILKSQDRGIREGVYIKYQERILKPSVELLQKLMSIPESFNVSWQSQEQATETLGQSVDYELHKSVLHSLKAHLQLNCGPKPMIRYQLSKS